MRTTTGTPTLKTRVARGAGISPSRASAFGRSHRQPPEPKENGALALELPSKRAQSAATGSGAGVGETAVRTTSPKVPERETGSTEETLSRSLRDSPAQKTHDATRTTSRSRRVKRQPGFRFPGGGRARWRRRSPGRLRLRSPVELRSSSSTSDGSAHSYSQCDVETLRAADGSSFSALVIFGCQSVWLCYCRR